MSLSYPERLKDLRSAGDIKSTLLVLLPWAGLFIGVAAFLAELLLPLRVGLGACYVLAVLTTFGHPYRYTTFGMSVLVTLLAVFALIPAWDATLPVWSLVVNRIVTVAAIWASAACLLAFSRLSEQLRSWEIAAHARQAWLAQTLASIGDGVIASDAQGRVEFMNEVAETLTGWPEKEAVDKPIEEVFDLREAESGDPMDSPVRRALSAGHIVVLTEKAVLQGRDGNTFPLDDSAAPIRDDRGEIIGAVMVFRDVTQRRRDREQMELRLSEAGHRIRNVFANVRAIMTLCERGSETPADLVRCVDTRMSCLMRSTDRLMYASEEGSSAREIIIDEVEPYLETARKDRLHISGEDMLLNASAAVSLGMIVHELANNAAKYGSLSVSAGSVEIVCRSQEDETLVIEWNEVGGPPVEEPKSSGLGTQIIGGLVRTQFRGRWKPDYAADGFACRIELPLKRDSAASS